MGDLDAWLADLSPLHCEYVTELILRTPDFWLDHLSGVDSESSRALLARNFWNLDVMARLEELLAAGRGVADGMAEIIALCFRLNPHPHWDRFRDLPIEADLDPLAVWLETAFAHPPDHEISGLWFGLFNPTRDDGEPTSDIYVCGSPYDPQDTDWACAVTWKPRGAYAGSTVLDRIYSQAYPLHQAYAHSSDEQTNTYNAEIAELLTNDAEYALCLSYGCLSMRSLINLASPALILGNEAIRRAIFVGFDDGDRICLGLLTHQGLQPFTDGDPISWPTVRPPMRSAD